MGISYQEKAFHAGKKIRKNDFAPSEKYTCYAPDPQTGHPDGDGFLGIFKREEGLWEGFRWIYFQICDST